MYGTSFFAQVDTFQVGGVAPPVRTFQPIPWAKEDGGKSNMHLVQFD